MRSTLSPATAALLALTLLPSGGLAAERPTEPFRREHVAIMKHLDHVGAGVGELATLPADRRLARMKETVDFLQKHIRPHAEWEEKVLYPAVDKRACTGTEPFTASMRYEHRIVGRWIDELAAEAQGKAPDVARFTRRTDNLLGLIHAHFEEEEQVLLPILDRTMTAEEYKREIGAGGHE